MCKITAIQAGSPAARHGIYPGDQLVAIEGEPLLDEIDYQALTYPARFKALVRRPNGVEAELDIHKAEGEPFGLRFDSGMTLSPTPCRNRCVFCFIDQMPKGMRDTLYVKDDDWRFSLMMGNYITLSSITEAEWERLIRRKASPLYVSVHATEPLLRSRLMGNPMAGDILKRLRHLKAEGIRFHCQIVTCPGINDGDHLLRTLVDLRELSPAAQSVAVVPVGLTGHREGLADLIPFDAEGARSLLQQVAPFQEECLKQMGTRFAFPSDEFYCLAGEPIPPAEWYERYPQTENGVGLLRLLESELEEASREECGWFDTFAPRSLLMVTGESAAPHMRKLAERYKPAGTEVEVLPIHNRFFGDLVTVAGLLTAGDILDQLPPRPLANRLLLPASVLRYEGDRFLDNVTTEAFRARAPLPVTFVGPSGQDFYRALREPKE